MDNMKIHHHATAETIMLTDNHLSSTTLFWIHFIIFKTPQPSKILILNLDRIVTPQDLLPL
jgi:hypothetical protein